MEDLKESIYYLIGKHSFTDSDSKEFVDWAVSALENGYDSDNIRILAGLDDSDTEERLKYFKKSIEDLEIIYPIDKNELLDDFTKGLANKVISGKVTPGLGLKLMLDVVRSTNYSSKYIQFADLDEDIDYVGFSEKPLFNSGLNKDNIDEMIKNEFDLFLQSITLGFNIREFVYCNDCKKSAMPSLKRKFSFIKSKRYNYNCCSECGSTDLIYGNSQEGKRMILETVKK